MDLDLVVSKPSCATQDSGKDQSYYYMSRDEELLGQIGRNILVHSYHWTEYAMTLGIFTQEERWLKQSCTFWVRRPTGGGIMVHGTDLTFSFLTPPSHPLFKFSSSDLYRFWHSHLLHVIKDLCGVELSLYPKSSLTTQDLRCESCFGHMGLADGMLNGKKVLGSAIRRKKEGMIHQFCIFLQPIPESFFLLNFLDGQKSWDLYREKCSHLLESNENLSVWRNKFQEAILDSLYDIDERFHG